MLTSNRVLTAGFLLPLLICFSCHISHAQKTLGTIERLQPEFDRLVDPHATIEVLASGFTWTEGPVWIGGPEGYLLFSDIPRNSIFKWQAESGISLFMSPSGYTGVDFYGKEPGSNGLLLDLEGRLIMCEHGDRRLSVLTKGGGKLTLADRYQGKRLNSPNDAVLKSNGDIYFTDPPYGLPNQLSDNRCELEWCGVYRLATDGTVTLLSDKIDRPNGIGFSPDESILYVAQSDAQQANWTAFQIAADGTADSGSVFYDATDRMGAEPGAPDGLAVDSNGNLWATGPGGVFVFSPNAELLGRILTGQRTSNCSFGPDGWLYMTVDSYLCRIKTNAAAIR